MIITLPPSSYTGTCQDQADFTTLWVDDGSYTLLRLRQPGESLQEIKIFNGFANDPAAFEALVQKLSAYAHPSTQTYLPNRAALIFQHDESQTPPPPEPFRLDRAYLPSPSLLPNLWAVALSG